MIISARVRSNVVVRCGAALVILALAFGVAACKPEPGSQAEVVGKTVCDLAGPVVKVLNGLLKVPTHPAVDVIVAGLGSLITEECKNFLVAHPEVIPQTPEDVLRLPTTGANGSPPPIVIAAAVQLPTDAIGCPDTGRSGQFGSFARRITSTSCPFAEEVHNTFLAAGAISNSVLHSVYSPVTGLHYDMYCTGTYPVICAGGNNAAVYIY